MPVVLEVPSGRFTVVGWGAVTGNFQAAATTAYGSSQIASNYAISTVTTEFSSVRETPYTAASPPPSPDAGSPAGTNNALAIGLGVGIGGGVLAIAVVATIIVVSKRRNMQQVAASDN